MQLLQLCEPLFQYVCRLNQIAALGSEATQKKVDGEIKRILKKIKTQASLDSGLADQFEKVLQPLVFFVDYMIRESQLPFNDQWQDIAYTMFKEMAGDEKFFYLLDEELARDDEAAAERIVIYYTCLGLGFKGLYINQPEQIKYYKKTAWNRISDLIDSAGEVYLCPEAYQHTDKRPIDKSVTSKLTVIMIVFVTLLVSWLCGSFCLFSRTCRETNESLNEIRAALNNTRHESEESSPTKTNTSEKESS